MRATMIRPPLPHPNEDPQAFAHALLAAIRAAMKRGYCPECGNHIGEWGTANAHGYSQIHSGDPCHLGRLIGIADRDGL